MVAEGRVHGRITEEGLEELRRRIGVEYPIDQPYNEEATRDTIRHFARGIGDVNPLWLDEAYAAKTRFGGIIAPPGFLYSAAWGAWDMRRGAGLPGVHGLHAGDRWEFFRPIRLNDRIKATRQLVALHEKQGSYAGRSILQQRQFTFRNQNGEVVATQLMSEMRTEREAGKKGGKYSLVKPAHYTPEELAAIEADYDREEIRGATPRYWEDVQIGEEVTPVVKGPVTVSDMITWVQGVGSPHVRSGQYWLTYRRRTPAVAVVNPETGVPEAVERVHWDNYLARQIGMPNAYDYGSQRGAWATHLLTNWAGDDGWVKVVDVQYRGMNFLGDTTWVKGRVTGKRQENGENLVDVEIAAVTQRGDNIMPGTGVVALPSRG
ncbi:MAG: MaoC family dehydratase N-terminal domain-containing protein [Chloroflexi bacterium]|nr:MaoC family dehydratase N-terminal domain-containing protein [Chloroflexota bacterium]